MRTESGSSGQRRSFIEQARRAQIVASAIEVIADAGYGQASLAAIARHAGISKGVISYHFSGKDELMETIVEAVHAELATAVEAGLANAAASAAATAASAAATAASASAAELVRAHVLSAAAYVRAHPSSFTALGQIFANRYGRHTSEDLFQRVEKLYADGQRSGEFRDFDVRVMAVTHQAAVENMFAYWASHPDLDLAAYASSLADLLIHAALPIPMH